MHWPKHFAAHIKIALRTEIAKTIYVCPFSNFYLLFLISSEKNRQSSYQSPSPIDLFSFWILGMNIPLKNRFVLRRVMPFYSIHITKSTKKFLKKYKLASLRNKKKTPKRGLPNHLTKRSHTHHLACEGLLSETLPHFLPSVHPEGKSA